MLKICLIITITIFASCVAYKKYKRQEVIEQRTNSEGKIILKKYRQLIISPGEKKVATITQEYDSLGRVIKEYGFDNPNTYDKKYFIQRTYRGSHIYLINKVIWETNDSTFDYLSFDSKLFNQNISDFEEHIYPDTQIALRM